MVAMSDRQVSLLAVRWRKLRFCTIIVYPYCKSLIYISSITHLTLILFETIQKWVRNPTTWTNFHFRRFWKFFCFGEFLLFCKNKKVFSDDESNYIRQSVRWLQWYPPVSNIVRDGIHQSVTLLQMVSTNQSHCYRWYPPISDIVTDDIQSRTLVHVRFWCFWLMCGFSPSWLCII